MVESLDTDVLILLMDLVSRNHLGALTSLVLQTGRGNNIKKYDIIERVNVVGTAKSQGLVGLHNFSGADWGGKFVGISKKRWTDRYLELESDDPIVETFCQLGSFTNDELTPLPNNKLHDKVKYLETFVCQVYLGKGPRTLPELRWELFTTKNLESELLPPTRSTLLPHIKRANFVCKVSKSYVMTQPYLPDLTDCGWTFDEKTKTYKPVLCLSPPAPKAVLELVKCGCKAGECGSNCSCKKNKLPCTSLCKCSHEGCTNAEKHTEEEQSEL